MYAARPHIQAHADSRSAAASTSISPRRLLPDYIEENGVDWNVVYDARGHFREPHTRALARARHAAGPRLPGRIDDRAGPDESTISSCRSELFPTRGPKHRFGAILFIEKEGFMPLFDAVQLAERFDIAIMSTKGMSVTAAARPGRGAVRPARHPAAGAARLRQVRLLHRRHAAARHPALFVLQRHQGDRPRPAPRRYRRARDRDRCTITVTGTRSPQTSARTAPPRTRSTFCWTSASSLTPSPPQLVAFIERKLTDAGVSKVVPEPDILEQAYRRVQTHIRSETTAGRTARRCRS